MPAYDYECAACGHQLEVIHGMSESGPKKCPACGKRRLRKVLTKPPAYHPHYSLMHPQARRGRGH